MHKYQKPFSEEGVTANLTQWYEQKQGLLQLLRKHPLWNEKELAIVFRVEERREIDRITVDETRAAILELGRRACTDDTVYENFETALRAATADYARIPNEYRLDTIRQYGGIKCAPGQKASRIINRLCLKFHLDQIEEETEAGEPDNRYMRTVRPYNALFARLADALNPAHIEKTAVLSMGDILITTFTVRNAVIAALPAERSLSVCRVSELPVPASSAEFALPAMSRLLAYAETAQSIVTAFPSVPIASARTK